MTTTDPPKGSPPDQTRKLRPARARLLGNYAFQLINQSIRVGWLLILVPLYLSAWGAALYKDWIVVIAISTFLSTCSLGLTTYFGNRFIELIAYEDREPFRRELRIALCCTLVVGIAVVIVGFGGVLAYDAAGLLDVSGMSRWMLLGCLLATIVPIPVAFWQQQLVTIYRAQGEFSRGECVFAIQLSTMLIVAVILLVLKGSPLALANAFLAIQLIMATVVVIDLRRRYKDISLRLEIPRIADLKRIIPQSLLFFTSPLSASLVQSGPIILFESLGVPALPIVGYTLMRTIAGLARQAAYAFAEGSGIEMARRDARGARDDCYRLYRVTGQIVGGLAGLFAGFTLWAAAPFLVIWTHGTVHGDFVLVSAFLIGILLSVPGQAGLMLLTYANVPRPLAVAWCAQAVVGLSIAAAFIPVFGVVAAAAGLAFAEIVMIGLCLPFVVQRHFGFPAGEHLLRCLAVTAATFGWSAFVAKLVFELSLPGFSGLVASGALWAVAAAPPCALLILPAEQRKTLLSRLWRVAENLA